MRLSKTVDAIIMEKCGCQIFTVEKDKNSGDDAQFMFPPTNVWVGV